MPATTWTLKGQQPLAVNHVDTVNIQVGALVAVQTVVKVHITTKTHKALVVATVAAQVTMEMKMDSRTAKHVVKVNIQVRELGAAVTVVKVNITTKPHKALAVATIAAPGVMEVKMVSKAVDVVGIVMLGNIQVRVLGAAVTAPMVGIKMEMLILAVRHAPLVGLQQQEALRAPNVLLGNIRRVLHALIVHKDTNKMRLENLHAKNALKVMMACLHMFMPNTKMKLEKNSVKCVI